MFSYSFRSPIKLYQNFGVFGGGEADSTNMVVAAELIDTYLVEWAKMQLSLQLKSYTQDAVKTTAYKDCVTVRINLYNSADPSEKFTLTIPCFKTANAGAKKDELGLALAALGTIKNKNGVIMDTYKASGVSAVRDVFVADTTSNARNE